MTTKTEIKIQKQIKSFAKKMAKILRKNKKIRMTPNDYLISQEIENYIVDADYPWEAFGDVEQDFLGYFCESSPSHDGGTQFGKFPLRI